MGCEGNERPYQPCYQRRLEGCPEDEGKEYLRCCRVYPHKVCIRFECYGEEPLTGVLICDGDGGHRGTMGEHDVYGYLYIDEYDECRYAVEIDDEVVATFAICDIGLCEEISASFPWTRGYCEGTVFLETHKPMRMRDIVGTRPGECKADIMLLVDTEFRMSNGGLADLQGGTLQPLIDTLTADVSSFRLGLIRFGRDDASLVQDLTGDTAAWLAAVDSLTSETDESVVSVDLSRRSGDAAELAELQMWDPRAKKLVVLVTAGIPGLHGVDHTEGNEQEVDQFAAVERMYAEEIDTHCVAVTIPNGSGGHVFNPRCDLVCQETASKGGGSYQEANQDGPSDENGGVNEIAPAVTSLAPSAVCDDGTCTKHFCCQCLPEVFCVTINITRADESVDTYTAFYRWSGTGECNIGWRTASWNLEDSTLVGATGTAEVVDDETLGCVFRGDLTIEGTLVEFEKVITDCDDLGLVVVSGDITVDIVPQECDECFDEFNALCCPDSIPATLYLNNGSASALIPDDGTVVLTCINCPPETRDNYIERVFTGTFYTDWLENEVVGSGGSVLNRYRARIRVEVEYYCGSGHNLILRSFIEENDPDPQYTPLGEDDAETPQQNVQEFCDPILNIFDDMCVRVTPGTPTNYSCPQTYVVSE